MFYPQQNRKIPLLMATQHPDNAAAPFWGSDPFISANLEAEDIFQSLKMGCDEYMWDWEGKFADEAMVERLLGNYLEQFKEKQLGRDIFLTLRIPNIWEERTFKLGRAYMSVLSAAEFLKSLGLVSPPVFELILPMVKSADQMIHIQQTFQKTARLHESIFGQSKFGEGYIHIVPIFESVDDLAACGKAMRDFLLLHQNSFGKPPPYLRVFIARSDPAMNAGIVPAVLGCRMALRELGKIEKETGVPVYPIIGTGCLPFRGGINPENIENSLPQYKGVRTVTIQSAFRYDYPLEEVSKGLDFIKQQLEKPEVLEFSDEEFAALGAACKIFQDFYKSTVENFAPIINEMAQFVPERRERLQHTGLFGYSRGVGAVKLPRAIRFTGACYSLGIPPEFIGTGRGLAQAQKQGLLPCVEKHFFTLRHEIRHAGKFLNVENLQSFAAQHSWARDILTDIRLCSEILKIELGPQKDQHFLHRNLTSNILLKRNLGKKFTEDIVDAALLRRSLG